MEPYIAALDEYFMAQYSDYSRLSAFDGYEMPEMLVVGRDGNLTRKDPSFMRLCYQKKKEELLAEFKEGLCDTDFTFSFAFRPLRDRLADPFRKYTFAKILPAYLKRCGETVQSAGEKLEIEPRFWRLIGKGKLYPEKNTVYALALACRMGERELRNLFSVCGYAADDTNVRDVVAGYLIREKIFNAEMRDRCLAEYRITNLPIKR